MDTTDLCIASIRDPDGEPVCEVTWGPLQWYPQVSEVRETAADLMTCAAYAEMMMTLITEAKLPPQVVTDFTTVILRSRKKRMFGTPGTVELMPAGASRQKQALVLLKRNRQNGALTPDEARDMALNWLTVAEATESDQLLGEALRAVGVPDDTTGRVFGYLRQLRSSDQPHRM